MPSTMDAPHAPALREAKQALRAHALALRDALPEHARAAASAAIAARIERLPVFAGAHTILLTLPFGSEWDSWPLAQRIAASHRRLVVPRVERTSRMLALHVVDDLVRDVEPGFRGIPEPRPACPVLSPTAVDLVILPGVAFDMHGGRLGYGGGFYDRLLPLMRPDVALVGAAFDEQVVAHVPMSVHDQRIPCIVTPTRLLLAGTR